MQYIRLGKSDLLVSRICMGCMGFGDPLTGQHRWTLDETASRDIIRYGLEKGINFYDTAIAYQNGSSERYVGRARVSPGSNACLLHRRVSGDR
ncbi:aldo/keto reductase, partial [Klebsiella pneumoniae]